MQKKAFVLGAGLGTRLRPLTEQLPKPLVPFFHRPLIAHAFDHLLGAGVEEFVVNTHHLPEAYEVAFPEGRYRGARLTFRHEPVLLETGGGIANVADLMGDEPFVVYNGDILTDLPLKPLLRAHEGSGHLVTLVLRSEGSAKVVGFDAERGLVTDILNRLKTGNAGTHQFTGVYVVSPDFVRELTPGKVESVVPVWLRLMAEGRKIGGVVVDEGEWWDLGDRRSYLDAHWRWGELGMSGGVHAEAQVAPGAVLSGMNVVGPRAVVGAGALLEGCVLWPDARVAEGAVLRDCVVRSGRVAEGELTGVDV